MCLVSNFFHVVKNFKHLQISFSKLISVAKAPYGIQLHEKLVDNFTGTIGNWTRDKGGKQT